VARASGQLGKQRSEADGCQEHGESEDRCGSGKKRDVERITGVDEIGIEREECERETPTGTAPVITVAVAPMWASWRMYDAATCRPAPVAAMEPKIAARRG
jgi:hypothetical protein